MPPYIPHESENEEQEIIVLKHEEDTFKKLKHNTDRATKPGGQSTYRSSWRINELTEKMIRILWGSWGSETEREKKNNKTWKPLKNRMETLNLIGTSMGKPAETERTALLEELAEANNEKPEE